MKNTILPLALLVLIADASYGQGTIIFANSAATRFQLQRADGVRSNVPPGTPLYFGIFWGTTAATISSTPVQPFGTMSTIPGVMAVPNPAVYQLPGTEQGQDVFARVRGWSSSFGSDWQAAMIAWQYGVPGTIFGETDIRELLPLGPAGGPGARIWQSFSQTNPNIFQPLVLYEAVPEPSVLLLSALAFGFLCWLRLSHRNTPRQDSL